MEFNKTNMDKLDKALKTGFAQELWEGLKAAMPEGACKFADDQDGIRCLREALVKAENIYKFAKPREQARFAYLTYVVGPGFDLDHFVHSILTEELWHPMDRLEHITGWVEIEAEKAMAKAKGDA